jgi:very-short-patch-repair endonuclease
MNQTRVKTDIEWAIDRILTRNNIQFEEKVKVGKYIPDFICGKVIIEADGLYYHSEKFADRYYHFNKREEYIKLGYKPLFFTSDEIQHKPLIIESIIKNKLGLSERIYGRKTTFQKISKQEGKEFLNENHLMGNGAGDCYSLSYNNTIFSVIQIKPAKDNAIEISRFCIKNGYSIVGGFSKLLKHLDLNRIKTFVDLRYGNGEHLKNLGFTENKAYPSFSWTDGYSKFHRMKFPKNSGYNNNLVKIWDCGQKCFVNY